MASDLSLVAGGPGTSENCRLIFGEADDMPQLIIDKFNDYFVLQTLALGIDVWKPSIVKP